MDRPSRPFVPPHCPRSSCRFHVCADGWRWIRFGSFSRQCEPRIIERFRCCHCRATFSTQTFSETYWLKRPELLLQVAYRLLSCSGLRQICREAHCAHSTVALLAARLGRQALLVLAEHLGSGPVEEALVVDGFEGFAHSQYQPLHLNNVVGAESHYVYAFSFSALRRKGRMTERQKRCRARMEARHGRPDPKAIERGMAAALAIAVPEPQPLTVRSDEHPAYPRAFRRLAGHTIKHECTPSVQARTPGNPLFPVNLLDLLLRHNSSHLKRETIAFAKCFQAVIERAAPLIMWRNFHKPFSENHGGGTPAMRRGICTRPLSMKELLKSRLFPARIKVPELWMEYYRRLVPTVGIQNPQLHTLKLAF